MDSKISCFISNKLKLCEHFIVTRVQPKTSKGITDLLLSHFLLIVLTNKKSPSKKPSYGTLQVISIARSI